MSLVEQLEKQDIISMNVGEDIEFILNGKILNYISFQIGAAFNTVIQVSIYGYAINEDGNKFLDNDGEPETFERNFTISECTFTKDKLRFVIIEKE